MKTWQKIAVFGAVLFALSLLFAPFRNWVYNNLGPMHIVVLHLPIGMLMLGGLMELAKAMKVKGISKEAVLFTLLVGAFGAVIASVTGFILHNRGGYDEGLVSLHLKLGIATTLLAFLTWWLGRKSLTLWFRISLGVTLAILTWGGHLGGSMTHGEEFLTENLDNFEAPKKANASAKVAYEEAMVWPHVIEPIIAQKCRSCHNPGKLKGGLLMMDSLTIMQGGDRGSIFSDGGEVRICDYLHFPLENKLHMPPKGKAQLTEEESDLFCWWAEAGAPFTQKVANSQQSEAQMALLKAYLKPMHPIDKLGIEAVPHSEVLALNAKGIRVYRKSPEAPWLVVNLSDRDSLASDTWQALEDIEEQIVELDLGNSPLTTALMDWVPQCQQLLSLKLDQCIIPEGSLVGLATIPHLEKLNLYGATLPNNNVQYLAALEQVQQIYLWQSSLDDAEIAELRAALPQAGVEAIDPAAGFPKQKMIAPYLSQASPFVKLGDPIPIACQYDEATIRYTYDGSNPTENSPILQQSDVLESTIHLKARAFLDGWEPSDALDVTLVEKRDVPMRVTQLSQPHENYVAQGSGGLIDEQIGEASIGDDQWLGYWGEDCEIVLDLGATTAIKGVAAHALEDVNSWVLFPKKVTIYTADEHKIYKEQASQSFDRTQNNPDLRMNMFALNTPTEARYVKLRIESFGKLPDWHGSAGEPAWLFLDEVVVY